MVMNEKMGDTAIDKKVKKIATKRKRKSNENVVSAVNVPKNIVASKIDADNTKLTSLKEGLKSPDIKKCKTTEVIEQYPILSDKELIQKLQSVSLTNNQKGRLRQMIRDSLRGTSEVLLPEVINNRIQAILKSSDVYTDSDLRKLRILYNMLKTALKANTIEKTKTDKVKSKKSDVKKKKEKLSTDDAQKKDTLPNEGEGVKKSEKENVQKVKGPKRYVVFVGNLPLDIDKEKIMQHFAEFNDSIVDVRLPKQKEGKKSAIAYVELKNEVVYELALSKHHSMLGNKRINVLYTTQKNGKITKAEAKSKSAKLIALQKSGKLIGSVPMNKKRSQRRLKMKQARAKLAAETI
ncbi:uncharacterized protein LOC106715234 [Papilio machaon]|uniref:uncharacterized protein LOC106715234 n=1 Tax=Papilio machaon TaxID=76193 RepID=UPI001E665DE6|nr:uncharacterized protein LOC106715234 [Papilio machaon]